MSGELTATCTHVFVRGNVSVPLHRAMCHVRVVSAAAIRCSVRTFVICMNACAVHGVVARGCLRVVAWAACTRGVSSIRVCALRKRANGTFLLQRYLSRPSSPPWTWMHVFQRVPAILQATAHIRVHCPCTLFVASAHHVAEASAAS
jgi:hypothetical protein